MDKETKKRKQSSKRVCPICRTSKFRSSEDGLVCKYGHKVLGVQVEVQEEFGRLGARERKRIKKVNEQDDLIPPAKRRSDSMIIIQYSLQVFGKCMVEDLKFPPELETTIRELWLLYISSSNKELYEAYIYEANELKDKDKNELQPSQMSFEKEEIELDRVIPSSDSESDTEFMKAEVVEESKKTVRSYKWPDLVFGDTIVFIYLACIYLNYPILVNDLIRWCHEGVIPFFDIQDRIPNSLLSQKNRFANNMTYLRNHTTFDDKINAYHAGFQYKSKLKFPDINIPLFLERFCEQLHLPVEGYYYAEYLFQLYRKRRTITLALSHYREHTSAVVVAMGCVLSAAKLIYEVNGSERYSEHVSQYNTTLTKAEWMEKIKENIKRYKSTNMKNNDINAIVKRLQKTFIVYRHNSSHVDKQSMIVNLLEQIDSHRHPSPQDNNTRNSLFMGFVDSTQEQPAKDSNEAPAIIKEGKLHYRPTFKFRQQDHSELIELASLIVGLRDLRTIERISRTLDTIFFSGTTKIPLETFMEFYDPEKKISRRKHFNRNSQ